MASSRPLRISSRNGRIPTILSADYAQLLKTLCLAAQLLEFADVLRQHGATPKQDMHALWRRIVFSVLISNTDDHLRNHGFLWTGPAGWQFSPAYDLNPVPADVKPRVLTTAIDIDDGTASLNLAYDVASYFELKKNAAQATAHRVGKALVGLAERGGQPRPE